MASLSEVVNISSESEVTAAHVNKMTRQMKKSMSREHMRDYYHKHEGVMYVSTVRGSIHVRAVLSSIREEHQMLYLTSQDGA